MRQLTDAPRVRLFMRRLGQRARASGRVYLVGGACAVLLDWRSTTVDIDLDIGDANRASFSVVVKWQQLLTPAERAK